MYFDRDGHMPQWIQNLGIGLAIVGAVLVIGAVVVLTAGAAGFAIVGIANAATWITANSVVTYRLIDGIIRISDMWIK